MSSNGPNRFRFRPRFRALAALAIVCGAVILGLAAAVDTGRWITLACGGAGVLLGLMYLGSPAWRIVVVVDDDGLEVLASGVQRFRLAWDEIREVVASPDTRTCFVDGGDPARSLLVPGPGASAPYDIDDKAALYQAIRDHVPAERVREVALLEGELRKPRPDGKAAPAAPDEDGASGGADPDGSAGSDGSDGQAAAPGDDTGGGDPPPDGAGTAT